MSYGFHSHKNFEVVGSVDAQLGKPSSGKGSLECNKTFSANIGIAPLERNLFDLNGTKLKEELSENFGISDLTVLSACPPCTGFSRANPKNHVVDDKRNSLAFKVSDWARILNPEIIVMENARELIKGNFSHHYLNLKAALEDLDYRVHGSIHFLSEFGLPQKRERALIVAVKHSYQIRTLEQLWDGYSVSAKSITVRDAIGHLPKIKIGETHPDDDMHVSPSAGSESTLRRLELLPSDGGSWVDLVNCKESDLVLTPAMKRTVEKGKFGSHPDIYGRMWWDRPAVTIKRECAHFGNGRYSHPEQNRLCTVREMGLLQGFPDTYRFESKSLANKYRHIGDAVPPLISFQIANMCDWILSRRKPKLEDCILTGSTLSPENIRKRSRRQMELTAQAEVRL